MTFPHNTLYQILPNFDLTIDTRFKDGSKPNTGTGPQVGFDPAAWTLVSNQIKTLVVGAPFSANVRSVLTGPESATATINVVTVSGTDAAGNGWNVADATNLKNTGASSGSGVLDITATDSFNNVITLPQAVWAYLTSGGSDSLAPTVPTGIVATPQASAILLNWDSSTDNQQAGSTATGIDHYNIYDGATKLTSVNAPNKGAKGPVYTATAIGSASGDGTVVSNNQWTLTDSGGGIIAVAEQCEFYGTPLAGDQSVACKVKAVVTGNNNIAGIMIRESNSPGAVYVSIGYKLGAILVATRSATNVVGTVLKQVSGFSGDVYFRVERVGNVWTYMYMQDGGAWNVFFSGTQAMALTPLWGGYAAAANLGVAFSAVLQDFNIAVKPQVSNAVASTVQRILSVTSVDTAGNESAKSLAVTASPLSSQGSINSAPGHYFIVGNIGSSNGVADNSSQIDIIESADVHDNVKGYGGVYQMSQLEGDTLGDYSKCDAALDPMVAKVQSIGKTWSVFLNVSGNVSSGSTTFRSWPAYGNSTTYGPIDANGNHGAVYYTSTVGPVTRLGNDNVCARIAALGDHIWSRYGRNIFAFFPVFSEIAFSTPLVNQQGFTYQSIVDAFSKTGGFFDKLRANGNKLYIGVSLTYLSGGNLPALEPLFEAGSRNQISFGNYDSTNETGGKKARSFPVDVAYRGGALVSGVFQPVSPLVNRVGLIDNDFYTHTSGDALNQRNNNVVPPAYVGDGRLTFIWQHDLENKTSHKWWHANGTIASGAEGPNCNRVVKGTTHTDSNNVKTDPPADYAESAPWAGQGLCGFINFIGPPPRQEYPWSV